MDLGRIELGEACDLLRAFKTSKDKTKKMGHWQTSEVVISFDADNGIVYLADDLGNLARMEDGYLVDCKRIR
jgi:hypothetical protein